MPGPLPDRRQFLGSAAAAAAFVALHDLPAWAAQASPAPFSTEGRPRILTLELASGAPLGAMKEFYGKTLDLGVGADQPDRFAFDAGETRLTFIEDGAGGPRPFYHFAFDIPENKIRAALEWQKSRTPLLPIPDSHRAAGYPAEVAAHAAWNAHSIFFLDPAGNLVEYIARHDVKNSDNTDFSWADLLYISEIALVVDDVPATMATLKDVAALGPYRGSSAELAAMGDEFGMVLVTRRGRRVDFAPDSHAPAAVHRTALTVRGPKAADHPFANYPYRLGVEERCSCA